MARELVGIVMNFVVNFTIMGTIKIEAETESDARRKFKEITATDLCKIQENIENVIMDDIFDPEKLEIENSVK